MTEYALSSRAEVPTDRPERWAKQLVSHLSNRLEPREVPNGHAFDIGDAEGRVLAEPGRVVLTATADDEDALARVEDVLGRHLERFGDKEELKVVWHR
ncbi:DUF2218 domain-containing protein [Leifsonia sp. NPDC058292]|uniref:DUF2218 domain-containing protein n=1 Tax=Leifsonia sp. NPDC058292 TaxID=3346428 RepID=UPI0036DE3EE2